MLKYSILIIAFISSALYGNGEVKLLPKNFLDTKIGTIENQKMLIPQLKKTEEAKELKKIEPKKVVMHKEKKDLKNLLLPLQKERELCEDLGSYYSKCVSKT